MNKKQCTIEDCNRPHMAKGWCKLHWQRNQRTGTTDGPYRRKNGAGWIDPAGYKILSINSVKIREHRFIMQNILGRKLARHESVHHIDGNRLNNHPSNLEVIDAGLHSILHKVRTFRSKTHKQCTQCKIIKPRWDFPRRGAPKKDSHGDPDQPQCKRCLMLNERKRRIAKLS